jgi:hypothetical protein
VTASASTPFLPSFPMSQDAIWHSICLEREAKPATSSREHERNLRSSFEAASVCEQTSGQNMVEHGLSVRETYERLLSGMRTGDLSGFRLPVWWAVDFPLFAPILERHAYVISRYQVMHDCGKHLVRAVSESGRVSYPDHAAASANEFERLYADSAMPAATFTQIRELIANDMAFHTGDLDAIASLSSDNLVILAVTALCELHSNALMFGGIESDSFKIKWRKWEKLTRRSLSDCVQ